MISLKTSGTKLFKLSRQIDGLEFLYETDEHTVFEYIQDSKTHYILFEEWSGKILITDEDGFSVDKPLRILNLIKVGL